MMARPFVAMMLSGGELADFSCCCHVNNECPDDFNEIVSVRKQNASKNTSKNLSVRKDTTVRKTSAVSIFQ
jgi:hypothetical protein